MQQKQVSGFRLSPQQADLWPLYEKNAAFYQTKAEIRINGALDPEALRRVWHTIIARHEILRTTFPKIEGVSLPVQAVVESTDLSYEHIYTKDIEAVTATFWAKSTAVPPLSPLQLTLKLLQVDNTEHRLLLTLPALCADAITVNNLIQELANAYAHTLDTDDDPLQYIDYSEWQHQLQEDEEAAEGSAFWNQQHLDEYALGSLPFCLPGGETAVHYHTLTLDPTLTHKLQAIASQHHTTIDTLLLACWQGLLFRLLGQEQIAATVLFDGRTYEDLAHGLGLFARALPLLTPMTAHTTLVQQIQTAAHTIETLTNWQEYFRWEPYEENYQDLTTFLFQFYRAYNHSSDDLQWHITRVQSHTTPFRLKLEVGHYEDTLALTAAYQTTLLTDNEAKRLLRYYQTLLEATLHHPTRPFASIPLLTESEQAQLINQWNETAAPYPDTACIHHLLEAQVTSRAAQTAAIFGRQSCTYQQLHHRANQLAHHLQTQGVQPDTLVGVYLPRSLEMLVAVLAVLKAGGAYLPLDPTHPAQRTQFTLQDTQLQLLLTQNNVPVPSSYTGQRILLDEATFDQYPTTPPATTTTPDNLAYVIYTSGSTGKPKGTLITHRGLVNYLSWARQTYLQEDGQGAPLHSPLTFDLTVTTLFLPLLSGQPITLLDEAQGLQAFNTLLQTPNQFSFIKITPSHLEALNMQSQQLDLTQQTGGLIIGGEALFAQTLHPWQTQAPHTRFWNEYGPTETVVGCCVYEVPPTRTAGAVPIGTPIANTQLYILDSYLHPVPPGVAGELYIGGLGVARGYLNRPALTADRFIPHPFQQGERLYKTGDLVRHLPGDPGGIIQYLGRLDQQVKIRGYRVELGEIEAVLRNHTSVQETAVLLSHNRLTAYLLLTEALTTEQIRAYLQPRLPDYMIPAEFIRVNQFPLTGNGKLDRRTLATMGSRLQSEQAYVPPANELEEKLADIWQDVLNIKRVGTHDNFFELGGDSILNLQVVARVSQLGYKLIPQQLFEHPTIAELAVMMAQDTGPIAEQGIVVGDVPLLPIQHWFFEQAWPEPHHYNQTILLTVHKPLDETALQTAVQHIQKHHDALRLRFAHTNGRWQQTNQDETAITPLRTIDLRHLPRDQQAAHITQQATIIQKSLDLAQGPLWQVALFQPGADQPQRLLICSHHLVIDGVSWRILLEDLQGAYQQARQHEPIQLPPKTTSFKQWAEHLVTQAAHITDEQAYWLAQTADHQPLPTDKDGPPTFQAMAQVTATLSTDQTRHLLQDAHNAYNTHMNDLLLTALAETMQLWSGDPNVAITLEGHGREWQDETINLARTVGWFTTQYPINLELPDSHNLSDHILAIKKQLRQVPNKGIGYGLLRYLQTDSPLAQTPTPHILFNYLGQLDQALGQNSLFTPAAESVGPSQSTRGKMSHSLIINGSILNHQLQFTWSYSTNQFNQATIQALADGYIETLDTLITHCLEQETRTYSPEDFPDVAINQQQLDKILSKVIGK